MNVVTLINCQIGHFVNNSWWDVSADGVSLADGGEAVDVGVGEDCGEVGDEMSPLSLSTLPQSSSSWQKVDREPAFLPTNLMMMITMMLIALHLDDDGVDDPYYSSLWQLADPSNPFNSNEDRIRLFRSAWADNTVQKVLYNKASDTSKKVTTAAPVIPAVPNPTMVAA